MDAIECFVPGPQQGFIRPAKTCPSHTELSFQSSVIQKEPQALNDTGTDILNPVKLVSTKLANSLLQILVQPLTSHPRNI